MTTRSRSRSRTTLVPLATVLLLLLAGAPAAAMVVHLDADQTAARAVEVSHLVAASSARVEAAGAEVRAANAPSLPVVRTTIGASRRSSVPEYAVPLAGPGEPGVVLMPDITTTAAAGLGVEQVLYAGGAIRGGRRAAQLEQRSMAAASTATQAEVRLVARLTYWDAVASRARVDLAHARLRRAERLEEDSRALLDAGMAVRADVLAAEERVATARVELVEADAEAANALAGLRSMLHCSSDEELQLEDSLSTPPPAAPSPLAELVVAALEARPELEAARARVSALTARLAQARAAGRPRLAASAQLETARPNTRYFPLVDEFNDSWSVAVLGSWTLFDGGAWRSDEARLNAQQRAVACDLAELERKVQLEVEARRRELEAARAAVPAADAARAAAEAREEESRERFAAGLAATVEILDAQELLAAAELRQIGARAAVMMAAARLERAVGR